MNQSWLNVLHTVSENGSWTRTQYFHYLGTKNKVACLLLVPNYTGYGLACDLLMGAYLKNLILLDHFPSLDLSVRRRSSSGACLPSPASPHLSLMSRPGVNSLHSSGAAPYLNAVSKANPSTHILQLLATVSLRPQLRHHPDLI